MNPLRPNLPGMRFPNLPGTRFPNPLCRLLGMPFRSSSVWDRPNLSPGQGLLYYMGYDFRGVRSFQLLQGVQT